MKAASGLLAPPLARLAAIFFFSLSSLPAAGDQVTVAAASDLSFAFNDLKGAFERETGHTVRLVLGSSGNLFAQIQNGAPFDAFFSADINYPRQLEAAGLVEAGSVYLYALGRLVVWAPRNSPFDPAQQRMETLLDPSVKTIAIANPRHAPYGRAAVAALQRYGLYDKVKEKLVLGENISQAAQFVQSGSADAGLIAFSLAVAPTMKEQGTYWEIPACALPPLEQGAAVLSPSRNKKTARAFLDYVKGERGRAILERYGFLLPETDKGAAPAEKQ